MQAEVSHNAQDPTNRTEKKNIEKKDRFTWWQALIILAATLVICLSAGYFICEKYFWNQAGDQITQQLNYYKAQIDKKPNDANLRVQLGYSYFLKGNTEDAINQYKTAVDLDKTNYSAYLNLAIAYDQKNKNDDALQMALKAQKLSTSDYKPYYMEGRSYRKLKMYKKASDALQTALRFKPANDDILNEVALVAEGQGKKSDAISIYKQILSYDPTYKPAQDALSRLNGKK